MKYGHWFVKMLIMSFFAKWGLETYELVEKQMKKKDSPLKPKAFDPYKLLHIEADGSFGTEDITLAFDHLAAKYHPSRVDKEKVPYAKAMKRYDNLVKAHKTLTIPKMYNNWQTFGDPLGCLSYQAF